MIDSQPQLRVAEHVLSVLGLPDAAGLFLDRCQVDTPLSLVRQVWQTVAEARPRVGSVVDFGAGDGRFAEYGRYTKYIGYEIDPSRSGSRKLPPNARIVNACAFSKDVSGATVAIGNPPFVRNQDLPEGWRQQAAEKIQRRLGIKVSGLANAWQYFFLLSLASTVPDGLVVLVLPYEWVSRPSSKALRDFIRRKRWAVKVYRLDDETFDHVLTTSSITVVDKATGDGSWQYFREGRDGFARMRSPTGGKHKLLPYLRSKQALFRARRGLSPGTQIPRVDRVRARTMWSANRNRCRSVRHQSAWYTFFRPGAGRAHIQVRFSDAAGSAG